MKREVLSCLVLSCVSAGMAAGQAVDSQQISGTITDPSGASVPGATVTVTNTATGATRTAKSNGDGVYDVLNIPVGTYNITIDMQGFKKSVISGVNVDVGGKPAVPVTLSLGSIGETVEVRADSIMIQTTTAEIGVLSPARKQRRSS